MKLTYFIIVKFLQTVSLNYKNNPEEYTFLKIPSLAKLKMQLLGYK